MLNESRKCLVSKIILLLYDETVNSCKHSLWSLFDESMLFDKYSLVNVTRNSSRQRLQRIFSRHKSHEQIITVVGHEHFINTIAIVAKSMDLILKPTRIFLVFAQMDNNASYRL